MIEVPNQIAIFIGKKNYSKNFWDSEAFLRQMKPKYVKWQNAWQNRILHYTEYTPRYKPAHKDVDLNGIIETYDPKAKKEASQVKTIKMSPLFGPEIVKLLQLQTKRTPHLQSSKA